MVRKNTFTAPSDFINFSQKAVLNFQKSSLTYGYAMIATKAKYQLDSSINKYIYLEFELCVDIISVSQSVTMIFSFN